MPAINITNKGGPTSRDLKVLVKDIALQLHDMPADDNSNPPGHNDYLRRGKLLVDSVGNDCVSMSWVFPKGGSSWGTAATMDLTVGRSPTRKFVATLSMRRVDNTRRDYLSEGTQETAVAAVSNVLHQVLEDPWDSLVGHLYVDDVEETAAYSSYAVVKRVALWAANTFMGGYFIYMVASRGLTDAAPVNTGDVILLASVCLGALSIITWMRSRVVAAAHNGVRKALLTWAAPKGRY